MSRLEREVGRWKRPRGYGKRRRPRRRRCWASETAPKGSKTGFWGAFRRSKALTRPRDMTGHATRRFEHEALTVDYCFPFHRLQSAPKSIDMP